MLFNVKVVSEADYQAHMDELRRKGFTGQLGSDFDRNTNLPGTGAPKNNE
jgi:cytochrome c oxidase subunit 2